MKCISELIMEIISKELEMENFADIGIKAFVILMIIVVHFYMRKLRSATMVTDVSKKHRAVFITQIYSEMSSRLIF